MEYFSDDLWSRLAWSQVVIDKTEHSGHSCENLLSLYRIRCIHNTYRYRGHQMWSPERPWDSHLVHRRNLASFHSWNIFSICIHILHSYIPQSQRLVWHLGNVSQLGQCQLLFGIFCRYFWTLWMPRICQITFYNPKSDEIKNELYLAQTDTTPRRRVQIQVVPKKIYHEKFSIYGIYIRVDPLLN